jgi:hypothetical protein
MAWWVDGGWGTMYALLSLFEDYRFEFCSVV